MKGNTQTKIRKHTENLRQSAYVDKRSQYDTKRHDSLVSRHFTLGQNGQLAQ